MKKNRWVLLAEKIKNSSIDLAGYADQLKRDSREFRDNSQFSDDYINNVLGKWQGYLKRPETQYAEEREAIFEKLRENNSAA